jgi:hypothetical protein
MKKFFAAIGIMAWAFNAFACDVCGCSAGGNTMGILPRFGKNFMGVKYSYAAYNSQHLTLFANEVPAHSNEYFTTATLWGRYMPHKRVQLFAFLPYNYSVRSEEGANAISQGWGDATFLGNYVLLNTTDSMRSKVKHALQVGAGLKLPTGAINNAYNNTELNINMQPGSGSVDVPINLLYTVRYKNFGINTEAGYTLTTANKNGYWFGDKFISAARLFYWKNYRNTSFLPQVGVAYEHRGQDWDGHEYLNYTGGTSVALTTNLDVYFYKFAIGLGIKQPVANNLGGGNILQKTGITSSIVYLF